MPENDLEGRMRDVEMKVAVHEAVCGERYKTLARGQWITHGLLLVLITIVGSALAGDNLLVSLLHVAH